VWCNGSRRTGSLWPGVLHRVRPTRRPTGGPLPIRGLLRMHPVGGLLRRERPRMSRRGCGSTDPRRPWGRTLPVRSPSGPKSAPLPLDGMRRGRAVMQNHQAGRLLSKGSPRTSRRGCRNTDRNPCTNRNLRMSRRGRGGTVGAWIPKSPWDRVPRDQRRPTRTHHRVLSASGPCRRRTPAPARVPVRRRAREPRISTASQRSRRARRISIRRERVPQGRPNNHRDLRSTPCPQGPNQIKRPATVPTNRTLPGREAPSQGTLTMRAHRRARPMAGLLVWGVRGRKPPTTDYP